MHYEPVDDQKLTIALRRAARVRYAGRPLRAKRERHPTMMRNLCVLAGFGLLIVLTAERLLGLL